MGFRSFAGRLAVCVAVVCVAFAAHAQEARAALAAADAVTAARTAYVVETDHVWGHEDLPGRMFRQTLETTKRFTLLPSTRGADVVLVFVAMNDPQTVEVRDGKTFALLQTLSASQARLGTVSKSQAMVTKLLDQFFALDHSGPVPSFHVEVPTDGPGAKREEWSAVSGPLSVYPKVQVPKKELSAGHSAVVVSDPTEFYGLVSVRAITRSFMADLGGSTGLRFVDALADADLVITVRERDGYGTHFSWSTKHHEREFLNMTVYDAKTLTEIVDVEQVVQDGVAKKGKPSYEDVAVRKLAGEFRKEMEKVAKH